MTNRIFRGTATAIATPFNEEGRVDYNQFRDNIEFQIENGINAIVVCGTTGESPTLNTEEHIEVIKFCVDTVAGRVPVIAGAGSNDTNYGATLAQAAEYAGADGLLLVTPYYNKCSQRGLIESFTAIADSVNIPCILYSVKSRTGVNIEPETARELANHRNIVGIKEASGDISQVAEILRLVPDDFAVYSGNDDMVVPLMSLGGDGVISVISNIMPKETVAMTDACLAEDYVTARGIQLDLKNIIDLMFRDVNPIPVKAALSLMNRGLMTYRLPLCAPSAELVEEIRTEMTRRGII